MKPKWKIKALGLFLSPWDLLSEKLELWMYLTLSQWRMVARAFSVMLTTWCLRYHPHYSKTVSLCQLMSPFTFLLPGNVLLDKPNLFLWSYMRWFLKSASVWSRAQLYALYPQHYPASAGGEAFGLYWSCRRRMFVAFLLGYTDTLYLEHSKRLMFKWELKEQSLNGKIHWF